MNKAPLMFISHGSPMVALESSQATSQLNDVGQYFQHAKAVVVMSAHWLTADIEITSASKPNLIYDFYGFPDELYQVQYPVQGSKAIAEMLMTQINRITSLPASVKLHESRGLDHGVWTPLIHLLPNPTIPVVQLSLPYKQEFLEDWQNYIELGRICRELRNYGIAFIGSGDITHNLREARQAAQPDCQAAKFELWVRQQVQHRDWQALRDAPSLYGNFTHYHPTPEHYLPLLFMAGAVAAEDELTLLQNPLEMGVISRESYLFS